MKPLEFTDANFTQEVINSDKPVLVDFWATWCGPCRQIAPAIEELAGEFEGKAKIGKLDVDNNNASATKFGVRSIPTLLLFKNGQVIEQIIGARPKAEIASKIKAALLN